MDHNGIKYISKVITGWSYKGWSSEDIFSLLLYKQVPIQFLGWICEGAVYQKLDLPAGFACHS